MKPRPTRLTRTDSLFPYAALFRSDDFAKDVKRRAELLGRRLKAIAATDPDRMSVKGRGMMQGIDVGSGELASVITSAAFEKGLIIETSGPHRSEEHTSELQSLMRISYAVFCLKKKKKKQTTHSTE